mmetsp:Transcript_7826/g.23111  ORF Transcript_7826/g.23111 Transcript_7826/m.23111 type:complete len:555 (+) Transcript_7826:328-1992(+)|eukprot:CAMPEP_0206137138 /NCGR_PEP_ID=MMETSP1473-20131121/2304_1 /ASSEMBLY_ACC=CAM_ASM_001109 /TAXON_ID=1461547 /ORGANISM="Stichococcus sp, Strain RCC1054" /LENGTH=554 /DNA_ID=CAMNT_0053530069 /DNA_START=233 /DNA_END=1897 /DNA_ORIENTATION=+
MTSGEGIAGHHTGGGSRGRRDQSDEPELDPSGSGQEVLLQGFNWECSSLRDSHKRPYWLAGLADKAEQIAEAGITAVWLPPPCQSIAAEGYMPQDYDSLSTSYGNKADLKGCIAAFHRHGLKALADVVINHRCAQEQGPDGKWNQYTGRYAWDASCIVGNQAAQFGGTGAVKTEDLFEAAPNLDHSSERVRGDLKSWLTWLRHDVGFDGWRLDFAKGYGGQHVKEYVEATEPKVVVGEVWTDCCYDAGGGLAYDQDPHRQRIVDWCDATGGTAAGFDFSSKGVLQEALDLGQFWRLRDAQGKPPGVIGWWPARAVTFIDNHDTGSTQGHWPFPAAHLVQGYVYILTHPGTPCVFYDHLFADGGKPSLTLWGSLKRLLSSGSLRGPLLSRESLPSQPSLQSQPSGSTAERSMSTEVPPGGNTTSPSRQNSKNLPRRVRAANSFASVRSAILELTALRRRAGLHCRSNVMILEADDGLYAAVIDGVVAMKLGPRSWCPNPNLAGPPGVSTSPWQLSCSGPEWAVWERKREGSGRSARSAPLPMPGRTSGRGLAHEQ